MPHVFISYSRKDLVFVRRLAADLEAAGLEVWWDLSEIRGGDDWELKITTALENSNHVVVVLSPNSVASRWVRREYLMADKQGLPILPLIYQPCNIPLTLHGFQPLDVQGDNYSANLEEILSVLGARSSPGKPEKKDRQPEFRADGRPQATNPPILNFTGTDPVGIPAYSPGGIEFVRIPAGKFIMGSKEDNDYAQSDEKTQRTMELPFEFYMARFPATNAQFAEFIQAKNYATTAEREGGWSGSKYEKGYDWKNPIGRKDDYKKKLDHPVVQVSWPDAQEYVKWLNETFKEQLPQGYGFRLPTEAEWEKAARGEYGNEWPWGNAWDDKKCNNWESGPKTTTPVGVYSPRGDSPYGCADMVGNVWEWTHSLYKGYPYQAGDGRESENASGSRVLRGGSWNSSRSVARCAFRHDHSPGSRYYDIGFRVCVSPIS